MSAHALERMKKADTLEGVRLCGRCSLGDLGDRAYGGTLISTRTEGGSLGE